jgi:hypothetical protein
MTSVGTDNNTRKRGLRAIQQPQNLANLISMSSSCLRLNLE